MGQQNIEKGQGTRHSNLQDILGSEMLKINEHQNIPMSRTKVDLHFFVIKILTE